MKYPLILAVALAALLSGCTSVSVRPVSTSEKITEVVIRRNSKVAVDDFLDVLTDGFRRHGIASRVISEDVELKDAYVVNYVAFRNWDMAPYLVDATISIDRNGRRVAEAQYHLKGKGGLALNKWAGTKAKIDPVMDQMLTGVAPATSASVAAAPTGSATVTALAPSETSALPWAQMRAGMTQNEVVALLGDPNIKSGGTWYYGERWVKFSAKGLTTEFGGS